MKAEARELYLYATDHFAKDIERIHPDCVSPLIATRQVVKKAICQYVSEYCEKGADPLSVFSEEDFQVVSNQIYQEIMEA